MASPGVLDFAWLLAPISGENPAGRPLRSDLSPTSVYHAIKDARSAARAAERSVVWSDDATTQSETPRKEWKRLVELAPKVIAEESKDLEVAAWLTEGLVREHGYAGLRDGFSLMRQLIESYWDTLYPLPDEDGLATRLAPVVGLNGEDSDGVLIAPITNIPVTVAGSDPPLSVADYRRALDLDRMTDPDKRAQRIEQGVVTLQTFEQALRTTPREFRASLQEDMEECSEEFEKLCALLEEKCGQDSSGHAAAPPSSAIRGTLEACRSDFQGVVRRLFGDSEGADADEQGDGMAIVQHDGQALGPGARVKTREDAFRMLLQVAEYFKQTEPHSPVAYALEQAVRWGRMPLPELLTELIPEQTAREQIFKIVGIQRTE